MLTASQVKKKYDNAVAYKTAENMYDINARLERFFAGDHWYGVPKSNLMQTTYNFITRLVTQKVASITAVPITINRRPDELSENEKIVQMAAKSFEAMDKVNWHRMKLDRVHQQVAEDAGVYGLGLSYYFWNDEIQTGNKFVSRGDIDVEVIDSIDLYVANPNECDIQKQDYVIIAQRKTVDTWKKIAKANNVPEDQINSIMSDAQTYESAFDKVQDGTESVSSDYATGLLYMHKKDKQVMSMMTVGTVTIKEEHDIKLSRYPLALFPWELRKRYIYGNSEIQWVINNQIAVNKMESMRMSDAMRKALAKLLYNKNMISSVSNEIGGIQPVNVPVGGNISNAMSYVQPSSSGIDFDKSIEAAINRTQELKNLNENVTGATRPDNFSAMLSAQEAAQVPLENNKKRYYDYVEDEALILEEFYKNYYNVERAFMDEGEEVRFTGTDYKDVYLQVDADVGASTQRSEALAMELLNNLFTSGAITALQMVERMPQNMIPEQEKLIEELGGGDEAEKARRNALMELVTMWMQQQPPEQQQAYMEQIQELPPNEQINFFLDIIAQQPAQTLQ